MTYKKNAANSRHKKIAKYADGGEVGIGEKVARYLSGGRDRGQRAFYNETRAGLWNSDTAPDDAFPMGGLGQSLKNRRALQAADARDISDAVPRRKGD